jgi:murein DD-endopeptidase MepM/ murein hydrolase activator NlpD
MGLKVSTLFILSLLIALPLCSEETVHVLRKGETIYSVARNYGVSVQSVLDMNGMTETDAKKAQAGRRLRIPPAVKEAEKTSYENYRVVKGDTLYSIARRYKLSLAELLEMNGFAPSYVIKEGEQIRIPSPFGQLSSPVIAATPSAPEPAKNPPPAEARTAGTVRWPVKAREVSYLTGKLNGVMVTGERFEPVKSLTQGTVVSAGPYRGFGRVAIVQVSGGYLYVYGGCESLSVKEGDKVTPGVELGKLGLDAKTEKPQLFFQVYRGNTPIDPAKAPRA